jgi:hypothetical protein
VRSLDFLREGRILRCFCDSARDGNHVGVWTLVPAGLAAAVVPRRPDDAGGHRRVGQRHLTLF